MEWTAYVREWAAPSVLVAIMGGIATWIWKVQHDRPHLVVRGVRMVVYGGSYWNGSNVVPVDPGPFLEATVKNPGKGKVRIHDVWIEKRSCWFWAKEAWFNLRIRNQGWWKLKQEHGPTKMLVPLLEGRLPIEIDGFDRVELKEPVPDAIAKSLGDKRVFLCVEDGVRTKKKRFTPHYVT